MYTGRRGLERGRRRKKWTSFSLVSSWEGSFGVQSTNLHLPARPFFFAGAGVAGRTLAWQGGHRKSILLLVSTAKLQGTEGGFFVICAIGPHIKDKQQPPITPFLSQPAHIFQPAGISLQVAHSNKNTQKYIVY